MKTFKTLPGNDQFFQRYATLIPTLNVLGYLAQIVSALTEFGIIYSLILSSLAEFWPEYAPRAALVGATVGTAFLEVGLRKFTPYSARAILERRFAGLDKSMTLFILAATVGLLAASGFLSFKGSKSLVEAVAPEPDQQTTTAADSTAQAETAAAWQEWQRDSAAIVARYDAQAVAIRNAAKSAVNGKRQQLRAVASRETPETRYTTKKNEIRAEIAGIEAERDAQLAALGAEQSREIKQAQDARKSAVERAQLAQDKERAAVDAYNTEEKESAKTKVKQYGGGLAYFTVLCLAVFVLSVTLKEIHHKGSEITEAVQISPYAFSPALGAELAEAVKERFHQLARTAITRFADATPAPPLPAAVAQVYDLKGISAPRAALKIAKGENQTIEVPTKRRPAADPEKALEYLAAAAQVRETAPAVAQELDLKADQVLQMYIGPGATSPAVAELRKACLDHLAGQGPNPFSHHHRRPIGYQNSTTKAESADDALTQCVKDASPPTAKARAKGVKIGNCKHCENEFEKRTTWQKYCSEDCRREAHAAKHGGKPFDPNFKPWEK